ncbi:MAG: N-acetylmuramoyl-L-alanine amidase-like domain-containing protein [Alphaproteobacteria bacterium]
MRKIFVLIYCLFGLVLLGCKSRTNNIEEVSAKFLGAPYVRNPLGEGIGIDKDPIFRFDKFDCLTFVETMLALGLSNNKEEFEDIIKKIRYKDGEVSIETRNHFVNPDWIKNNSDIVEDITKRIAKKINKDVSVSIINLDRKTWFKKNYNIDVAIDEEQASLDYIDFETLLSNEREIINSIKEPVIVNIVINKPEFKQMYGTEINTSHIGFVIPKDGSLTLRHASYYKEKVVDENFFNYIKMLKKYPKYRGINFLEIKF